MHQSVISSEGYRTLSEGWSVEFSTGHDEDGKIKADNVTGIGGGPCTGPRHPRRRNNKRNDENANDEEPTGEVEENDADAPPRRNRSRGGQRAADRQSQPVWHDGLTDDVKESLKSKEIRTSTGTIDIAFGGARIKLGTRGYSSMADAEGLLVEGSFDCDAAGNVTFEWKRAIQYETQGWCPRADLIGLIGQISLMDDNVAAVGVEEDMASLMGDGPDDPKSALESNGFEMRRVVLTAKRR